MNCDDTPNATSSAELEAGRLPCDLPDGTQLSLFGLEVVPASRSRRPAKGKARKTNGTSGPSSSDSPKAAARKRYLASKSHPQKLSALSLRLLSLSRFRTAITPERTSSLNDSLKATASITGLGGSIEYKQTWRERITPSGLRFWEHTASGRRTSDNGCTGWPTPNVPNRGPEMDKSGRPASGGIDLQSTAMLAGWATPRATDGSKGGPNQTGGALPADAALAGWATTSARDWKDGRASQETMDRNSRPLNEQVVMLAGWATPQTTEHQAANKRGNLKLNGEVQLLGPTSPSSTAETAKPGGYQLNASFSRWLMGFNESWDRNSPGWPEWCEVQDAIASADYADTETQSASP